MLSVRRNLADEQRATLRMYQGLHEQQISEGGAGTSKVFQARGYKGYKGVPGGRWDLKSHKAH